MAGRIARAVNLRETHERTYDVSGKANTQGKSVDPATGEVTSKRGVFGLTREEAQEAAAKANTLGEKKVYGKLDRGTSGMDEQRIKALAAAKAVKAAKDSGHAAGRRKSRKSRKSRRKTRRSRRRH
jgi:hypothetical protein